MFVLTLISDTIRIPPPLLSQPTLTSIQSEIEKRYPNKIIIDVGLILCPYGPPLQIGDGVLAPGDGGAHHQVIFQCLVFRPFVEEVLVGTVTESNEEGVVVSVGGFFDHVFIPAYWMLNPSRYDDSTGLWVWTPNYDDDDDEEEEEEEGEEKDDNGGEEGGGEGVSSNNQTDGGEHDVGETEEGAEEENRFEIEIGSEIRFKVKSVNFTRITTTMKGVQATTTTTTKVSDRAFALNGSGGGDSSLRGGGGGSVGVGVGGDSDGKNANGSNGEGGGIRRRSSSADLSDSQNRPAPMQIVGSICEDGLGLISWWKTAAEEEEEEEGEGDGEEAVDEYGEEV